MFSVAPPDHFAVFSGTPLCNFIVFFADWIVFSGTPLYHFTVFPGTPLCHFIVFFADQNARDIPTAYIRLEIVAHGKMAGDCLCD
jgi:hypothetical protein